MDGQSQLNATHEPFLKADTQEPQSSPASCPASSPASSQEDLSASKNPEAADNPSLHPEFPAVLNAYAQWGKLKGFNLCGATEKDRLYHVDIHTGYSGNPPLRTRPGVVLHNGMSSKAPILAAAGYDSQWSARLYSFNNESVILMPPLPEDAVREGPFVTEMMPGSVRGGQVVFPFSIEVEHGKKMRREKFEWIKFGKGVDDAAKEGGFKLVRVRPQALSSSVPATADSDSNGDCNGRQVLAMLIWRKLFPFAKLAFTVQFLGEGQRGELGERWSLMVVITALRLWALRVNGRTSKIGIAAGQNVAST